MRNSWLKPALFALVGGALGFGYYYFIGCRVGSCALSSNPYIMTGYGIVTGLVIGWNRDLFRKKKNREES